MNNFIDSLRRRANSVLRKNDPSGFRKLHEEPTDTRKISEARKNSKSALPENMLRDSDSSPKQITHGAQKARAIRSEVVNPGDIGASLPDDRDEVKVWSKGYQDIVRQLADHGIVIQWEIVQAKWCVSLKSGETNPLSCSDLLKDAQFRLSLQPRFEKQAELLKTLLADLQKTTPRDGSQSAPDPWDVQPTSSDCSDIESTSSDSDESGATATSKSIDNQAIKIPRDTHKADTRKETTKEFINSPFTFRKAAEEKIHEMKNGDRNLDALRHDYSGSLAALGKLGIRIQWTTTGGVWTAELIGPFDKRLHSALLEGARRSFLRDPRNEARFESFSAMCAKLI